VADTEHGLIVGNRSTVAGRSTKLAPRPRATLAASEALGGAPEWLFTEPRSTRSVETGDRRGRRRSSGRSTTPRRTAIRPRAASRSRAWSAAVRRGRRRAVGRRGPLATLAAIALGVLASYPRARAVLGVIRSRARRTRELDRASLGVERA
jgi:hypothetical protein